MSYRNRTAELLLSAGGRHDVQPDHQGKSSNVFYTRTGEYSSPDVLVPLNAKKAPSILGQEAVGMHTTQLALRGDSRHGYLPGSKFHDISKLADSIYGIIVNTLLKIDKLGQRKSHIAAAYEPGARFFGDT
jgi:hypothetical protein